MANLNKEYFIERKDYLSHKHKGKYVVIGKGELFAVFDAKTEAKEAAANKFAPGEFYIAICGRANLSVIYI